jgi:hypothetical protein
MKPSINFGDVARLRVTDEAALAEVLAARATSLAPASR